MGGIKFEFWWGLKFVNGFLKTQKAVSILVLVGCFHFRLGTYNVPEGPSANPYGEARSAELLV